jgi:choice-of-anchor B domain-containing protein
MKPILLAFFSAALLLGARLQAQVNVSFLGQVPYAQDLSDIWGWKNPADGREYALVGVFDGFSIVDVTVPTSPLALHFVPGDNSIWRDVKTWGNYAYVTNETGGGLLIVDLSALPGSITTYTWTGGSLGYNTAHNIFIDEQGVAYLCGSNGTLGTLFLDVDSDPINPPVLGSYTTRYVHDTYVRGDTMWNAEISDGIFSVVDITNKSAPVLLATQATSSDFCHNIWVSDDASWLVTTDEVSGAFIDAYDVSDLSDIRRINTWRSNPGSGVIPHNVFIHGQHLLTSYYRDGLTITDATYPDNLIQTGSYDTSPFSGDGFNGAWGVYPYLPSGNVLVTDIEEGLFVLGPTYVQAAYLRGIVNDSVTGIPIAGAAVRILSSPDENVGTTNISGQYATGTYAPGTYSVEVSRFGYETKTTTSVGLNAGVETLLDVELLPLAAFNLSGQVQDSITGLPVAFAQVALETADTLLIATADALGQFSFPGLLPGTYTAYAGQWGFRTSRRPPQSLDGSSSELLLTVNRGYADDFLFNFSWTAVHTASAGLWERGTPIGTSNGPNDANPYFDVFEDFGTACYQTGNGGGMAGTDDVDNGSTTLFSPLFDLSAFGDPRIAYERWFYNGGGSGTPNDSLIIRLSNGISSAVLETVVNGDPFESQWRSRDWRIRDFLEPGAAMQFSVYSADATATGHLVEGALDAWRVYDAAATATPGVAAEFSTSQPCAGTSVQFSDVSTGFPVSWHWQFPGASPAEAFTADPEVVYTTPGSYDVSLTVYNGEGTATLLLTDAITVLDSLLLVLATTPSTTGSDGTALVEAISGGTPPYTYLWNDPAAQTTKTAAGLAPGLYSVTVTSSEGCSATATIEVTGVVGGNALPQTAISLQAAPSPFAQQVIVSVHAAENAHWQVLDATGRSMASGVLAAGTSTLTLGQDWPAGTYHIILYGERSLLGALPVVKQLP